MPATATAPTNKYSNLEDIYENYTSASKHIFFEGEIYNYTDYKVMADADIHLYRCEKEMHNLKIYMRSGVPYLVEGLYSVEPIKL